MAKENDSQKRELIYKFKEIKLISFSVSEDEILRSTQIDINGFQFQVEFEARPNSADNSVGGFITLILWGIKENKELARLKMVCSIYLKDMDFFVKVGNGEAVVAERVMILLSSFAVSSARGMFAICSSSYPFIANAILPPIPSTAFSQNSEDKQALPSV